jgi:hypothetical protein
MMRTILFVGSVLIGVVCARGEPPALLPDVPEAPPRQVRFELKVIERDQRRKTEKVIAKPTLVSLDGRSCSFGLDVSIPTPASLGMIGILPPDEGPGTWVEMKATRIREGEFDLEVTFKKSRLHKTYREGSKAKMEIDCKDGHLLVLELRVWEEVPKAGR